MEQTSIPTTSTAESGGAPGKRRGPFLRLLRHPVFPLALQAPALLVLLWLIAAGWGRHGVSGVLVEGPLIYTNLATLGFWVIWLMGLTLFLPLAGRTWCTVCPVGGCSDLAMRVGAGRSWPRSLQNFAPMALLLVLFTGGSELYRLNRYPDGTALMLTGVLLAALVTGLIFRGRVFCRWLCPVGGMIGLYERLAPFEVGTRDAAVCRACTSKACYSGESRWYRLSWSGWHSLLRFRRPGCPAFIFPPEAAVSASCVKCAQCFKNCPYDNLRWGVRLPGAGLWKERTRDRSEALVLIVFAGIVLYRFARFSEGLRGFLEGPAAALAAAFPGMPAEAVYAVNYLFVLFLWPGLFFLLLAVAAKLLGGFRIESWPADGDRSAALLYDLAEFDERQKREETGWAARRHTLTGYLAAFSHAFIPLLAGAFAAFGLVKLSEKAGWLPLALADPAGIRTYLAVNKLGLAAAPESLVSLASLRWGALALVLAGLAGSFLAAGRVGAAAYGSGSSPARRGAAVFRLGILLAGVFLLAALRFWLFRDLG